MSLVIANPSREKILALEAEMMKCVDKHIVIETVHHFAPGIYAREIFIPKGTLLTGKIHRTDHINVVSKGRIQVQTEEGMREVQAPYTFVAKAGTKRVGYALEDTVWTTFHASIETDLDKLEAELIAPSFEALEGPEPQGRLEGV